MVTKSNQANDFLLAITQLEEALETPVVPGELPAWLESVELAAIEVEATITNEVNVVHRELSEQIVHQDPELSSRMENFGAADKKLFAQWKRFFTELRQLGHEAKGIEPDEALLDDEVAMFVETGLALVIESRKQDKTLSTWLTEAHNRDRGFAD